MPGLEDVSHFLGLNLRNNFAMPPLMHIFVIILMVISSTCLQKHGLSLMDYACRWKFRSNCTNNLRKVF